MTTFGGIFTGTFGTVALTLGLIGGIAGNVGMGVAALILGACTAASGVLLGNGCTSLAGLKRWRNTFRSWEPILTVISRGCPVQWGNL